MPLMPTPMFDKDDSSALAGSGHVSGGTTGSAMGNSATEIHLILERDDIDGVILKRRW